MEILIDFSHETISHNTDGKAEHEQRRKDMRMDDEQKRAIALLRAIKDSRQFNLCDIESTLITEYHSALDKLEGIGIDVSDFRIPDSWMTLPDFLSFGPPAVKRELFLIKLDAVLRYLS